MKWLQKKSPEDLRTNKFLNRASSEVNGFAELLQRFERNISFLGRSKRTFDSYSRHVAALALHFGKVPTELDPEDIKDYLFELQKLSKTPSQSYRLRPAVFAENRRLALQLPPSSRDSKSEKTSHYFKP